MGVILDTLSPFWTVCTAPTKTAIRAIPSSTSPWVPRPEPLGPLNSSKSALAACGAHHLLGSWATEMIARPPQCPREEAALQPEVLLDCPGTSPGGHGIGKCAGIGQPVHSPCLLPALPPAPHSSVSGLLPSLSSFFSSVLPNPTP